MSKESGRFAVQVSKLEKGVNEQNTAVMMSAIQELRKLIYYRLNDPAMMLSRLFGLLDPKYDRVDIRVKHEIARIAHRVLHQVIASAGDASQMPIDAGLKKQWASAVERACKHTKNVELYLNGFSSQAESDMYAAAGRAGHQAIHHGDDETKTVLGRLKDKAILDS